MTPSVSSQNALIGCATFTARTQPSKPLTPQPSKPLKQTSQANLSSKPLKQTSQANLCGISCDGADPLFRTDVYETARCGWPHRALVMWGRNQTLMRRG